jgi:hypothetical protein
MEFFGRASEHNLLANFTMGVEAAEFSSVDGAANNARQKIVPPSLQVIDFVATPAEKPQVRNFNGLDLQTFLSALPAVKGLLVGLTNLVRLSPIPTNEIPADAANVDGVNWSICTKN